MNIERNVLSRHGFSQVYLGASMTNYAPFHQNGVGCENESLMVDKYSLSYASYLRHEDYFSQDNSNAVQWVFKSNKKLQ